ncbi:dipeptidyl-peptidase-like protein IV [Cucurbitaria berberidis CBS 394.84]|uniref:dipeptidyl-peptidase IV n=1 Tax=Cucurbitaria berberidis CBS 394.84 TaxID=1168544 RepID=A0A9P4L8T8_9PLEO|nr:dipeptidyl-peptidase-like protein IV [Cucurbitaria berberidis CBS 394.84]KAF1846456.1 dipeptidyl-peptidase-like protein IV [Cucurbitaria berberidis CBS 394.84]
MRSFAILSAALPLIAAIDPPRFPHQPLGNGTKRLSYNITTDAPGPLTPQTRAFSWVGTGADGDYIYTAASGDFLFENVATGESRTFLSADKVPEDYEEFFISPDASHVLWAVNYTKQYRHSYFADYLIQDVATGKTTPLDPESTGNIQYAEWSPSSSSQIAFVKGNDLYLSTNGTITQITKNGGPDYFNAIPDWVYEEEVFSERYTLWFSPDGEKIAFLSFNETGVRTFRIPYYISEDAKNISTYPRELELRYPKVGSKNPTVVFNLLDVKSATVTNVPIDAFPEDDLVVGEVTWLTDAHSKVIYRAYNRVQDLEKLVVVDVEAGSSSITRERNATDGWLENLLQISYIGPVSASNASYGNSSTEYYLDISDESGWAHLYLFPVDGGDKIALTSGEWEVITVSKIDAKRGLVYYTSTEHHSAESHIYSVNFKTGEKKALVDDSVAAFWTGTFSSGGSYYVLRYAGPDVPYQELYSINSTTPIRTIVNNTAVYKRLQEYALPNITYLDLEHPSGYTLDAMLRLPPNFDPSKKYPLLLIPYGGPNAKEVHKDFNPLNWKAYIASDPELEYVTLTVDGRGTGRKGRKFRSLVTSNLGELEAEDQIWAAKELAKNSWIDSDHIGIWGWSYGGYLSSKVVEVGDPIISFALITAPVSDWRFYDSIYTERYMKTPDINPDGYNRSRVHDATGFKKIAGGVVIQHGTGDDNVHFQNSAALVDLLYVNRVTPDKLQNTFFTDSNHNINFHNGGKFLYRQLSKKLFEEKARKGDLTGSHQWSKKRGVQKPWTG